MILSIPPLRLPDTVERFSLHRPPAGWIVARKPTAIAYLHDASVSAITVLPQDAAATRFFCDNLEAACNPQTWTNRPRRTTSIGSYVNFTGELDHAALMPDALLQVPSVSADPRWQAAAREFLDIGECLAKEFLHPGSDRYLNGHIVSWTDFGIIGKPHRDNNMRHPLPVVATLCRKPTVIYLDGRPWQGPDYSYTVFKADSLWHCADMSEQRVDPTRPRNQAVFDLVEDRSSALR